MAGTVSYTHLDVYKRQAEMLEEPLERIQQIYNVIREHADWTEDEIYDRTAAALPGGPFFSNASEE